MGNPKGKEALRQFIMFLSTATEGNSKTVIYFSQGNFTERSLKLELCSGEKEVSVSIKGWLEMSLCFNIKSIHEKGPEDGCDTSATPLN